MFLSRINAVTEFPQRILKASPVFSSLAFSCGKSKRKQAFTGEQMKDDLNTKSKGVFVTAVVCRSAYKRTAQQTGYNLYNAHDYKS